MGGTEAQLRRMFNDAVTAFKNQQYDTVGTFLAPEIVFVSVRPPQRAISGKDNVIDLMKRQTDKPTFTPIGAPFFLLDGPDGVATTATISGTGTWVDQFGGPDPLTFNFKCRFANSWLCTDARTSGARPKP